MSANTLILSPSGAGGSFAADVIATLEREKIADLGNLSQSKFPLGDVRSAISEYPSVAMSGDRVPDVLRKLGESGELDGMVFIVVGSLQTSEQTIAIIQSLRDTGISRRRILGVINTPTFIPGDDSAAVEALGVRMSLTGAQRATIPLRYSWKPLADMDINEMREDFGCLSDDVQAIRDGHPMATEILGPGVAYDETDMLSVWAEEAADPRIVERLAPEAQVALGQAVRDSMIALSETGNAR